MATVAELVESESAASGVPTWITGPLVQAESGGNPNAVSATGAVGLLQLSPNYPGASGQNLRDPKTNLDIGLAQIAKYLQQHPEDMQRSLTSYEDVISHTGWDQWGGWASEGVGDVGGSEAVKRGYINAYQTWTDKGPNATYANWGPGNVIPDVPWPQIPIAPGLDLPDPRTLWGGLMSAKTVLEALQNGLGWMTRNPGQLVLLLIVVLVLISAAFHSMGRGDVVVDVAKKLAPVAA